jgi:hypothetical protein
MPLWARLLFFLPFTVLVVLVGFALNWWVAGFLGVALAVFIVGYIHQIRRFANRNANLS